MKITRANFDTCLRVMCKHVKCADCPMLDKYYDCDGPEYDEETAKEVKTILEERGLMGAVEGVLAQEREKNRYKEEMLIGLVRRYSVNDYTRTKNLIKSEIERRFELFINNLDEIQSEDDITKVYTSLLTGEDW